MVGQIVDFPATLGSTQILIIIFCNFVFFPERGKKNQRVFSLFFTSFSERRVQLLPGEFLTHINYLYWKVAHCRLLNSKFHIKKKKSTSKCDTAESKTCVAN